MEYILTEAIPRISPLYGVDKNLTTRVRAAKMLLSIISGKSAEEILSEQKLVKMLFGLCHDVNWKVRSLVA